MLAAAVARVVRRAPAALPLLERFTGVYLQDSTGRALPDELKAIWQGGGGSAPSGAARKRRARVYLPLPAAKRIDAADRGQLQTRGESSARVAAALAELAGLDAPAVASLRRYLDGKLPEFFLFLDQLHTDLAQLPIATQ